MDRPRWTEQASRIVPRDTDDLDPVIAPTDPRHAPGGRDLFPAVDAVLRPATAMKRADGICIGLRVSAALPDAADRAMRLVAFAAERDVEVVVLAETPYTGLERFGFRIEQIVGDTPEARATCEAQIRRFWNIDLVL